MGVYLNSRFDDGERLATEVGSNQGWADFTAWVDTLPARFKLLHALVKTGACAEPTKLNGEIHAAAEYVGGLRKKNRSAWEVANRLSEVLPDEGTIAIGQEPDDSEDPEAGDGGDQGPPPKGPTNRLGRKPRGS
jgi:hypothetical protein